MSQAINSEKENLGDVKREITIQGVIWDWQEWFFHGIFIFLSYPKNKSLFVPKKQQKI